MIPSVCTSGGGETFLRVTEWIVVKLDAVEAIRLRDPVTGKLTSGRFVVEVVLGHGEPIAFTFKTRKAAVGYIDQLWKLIGDYAAEIKEATQSLREIMEELDDGPRP